MILSAFAFSIMALFVKAVGRSGIPILEIVAARSVVSLLLSYFLLKHQGLPVLGNRKGLLFARGMVGFIALMCVFYSMTHLPLAKATVLQYLHPMFTAMLALWFLNERLTKGALICVGLSFVGLLFILQPDVSFSMVEAVGDGFAIFVAVLGAFGSAIAYTLVRSLNKTEHPLVIILYFPLVSLPISLVFLWGNFVLPEGITWLYLLLIGLATQVGQWGLTKSMQTETAGRATSFSYLQVVFAIVFGLVLFDEVPSMATLLGAGFIILGAYINVRWQASVKLA
ncbi:MAG: EamA family transporter [Piscirickettsiaceae bacterium]|nr:MAG: EamA family transporter [Piscirickettsiaceae bacterium]PCI66457.1 MAG: EamA family transporter [Piscirickettsiaceae bacterium]